MLAAARSSCEIDASNLFKTTCFGGDACSNSIYGLMKCSHQSWSMCKTRNIPWKDELEHPVLESAGEGR